MSSEEDRLKHYQRRKRNEIFRDLRTQKYLPRVIGLKQDKKLTKKELERMSIEPDEFISDTED